MKRKITYIALAILALGGMLARSEVMPQENWVFEPERYLDITPASLLCVDTQHLYVTGYHQVRVYTHDGTSVTNYGAQGSGDGQFETTIGIACDDQHLYVVDYGNSRVQVLTKEGAFVRKWGVPGSGDGQFFQPYDVGVDNEHVYVLDRGNNRIQVFTKEGQFVRKWGYAGSVSGAFSGVRSIAVNHEYVIVYDSVGDGRIQLFKKDGTFVRSWPFAPWDRRDPGFMTADSHNIYAHCFRYSVSGSHTMYQIYDFYGNQVWVETPNWGNSAGRDTGRMAVHGSTTYIVDATPSVQKILILKRYGRTLGPVEEDAIPLGQIFSAEQREGTSVLDIDYAVTDPDNTNVTVYMAAFVQSTNSGSHLADIVPMRTFVENTETNIGPGMTVGVPHRVSWDMEADGLSAKVPDYGTLDFQIYVEDDRELLDLHYLTIPAIGTNSSFQINRSPLYDSDFLPLWFWLLSSGDTAVSLSAGKVYGTAGAYTGEVLANGMTTTDMGRTFLFERLNVRAATAGELQTAREGETSGSVTEWDPRREPPPSGHKVNELNFVTSPSDGWRVVPLAP